MKKLLFLLFPFIIFGQTEANPCAALYKINEVMQTKHYKPKALNDSLSNYVFTTFLETLDENNKIFTTPEINSLKKHQFKIDDYIQNRNCEFLAEIFQTYTNALVRQEKILASINKELTTFESDETIQFSRKALPYSANETELKNRIKRAILFQILKNVAETSRNKDSLVEHFESLTKIAKKKIIETNTCKTNNLKLTAQEFNNTFYTVFCSYFDPHSTYFSFEDKASFLSDVSSNDFSFGLFISLTDKEEIVVDNVVPGSAAYFEDKIENGDQIIKIKTHNNEFEISCLAEDKIGAVFNSNEIITAIFTFRKKTGEVYSVTLQKSQLKNYDTNLYSYILKKGTKKVGYIKIPSFYGEFSEGSATVSDDLAKELYKLKKENIDGLIIDVQNNGGGSMYEAIKLTGMLIDSGPVAIMNDKENKTETIRDPNRGSIYNGPLVVLVNAYSASASEFFANAMQDYNRAIIVGSKTRGKASIQTILPIEDENNAAFVKVTIEAFYRITGKSNQFIGIKPDVEIPYLFDNQIERESEATNALPNDQVMAKMRFTEFFNPNKKEVVLKSNKRIASNENATQIVAMNKKIDALFDTKLEPIPLNFNAVYTEVENINSLWKDVKNIISIEYPIEIEQSATAIEYQQFDEFEKSSTLENIKAIKMNLPVFEAINIINDLTQ